VLRAGSWTVETQRPRPDHPIDESEVEALLGRALRLAINRLRGIEAHPSDWYLIEASPVAVTVDGHGVTDPVDFRGEAMGATVFAALARLDAIQMWERVARHLSFSTLTLSATPLALAAGLPVLQGLLLDIGGATTDVIWCQTGRPMRVDSVPVGGNALTDSLRKQWGLSWQQAENLKAAYSAGNLEAEARESVQGVLWPALQAWLESVELALANLAGAGALPGQIYLLGGGSALPEMEDAVRSLAWSHRLHFARYPQVRQLQPLDMPGIVNRTDAGRKMGDASALALLAWTARQQVPPDGPTRLVRELTQ
jgi:cell division protein FtsA